jgi:DNA mismatch repair ATPase MutL
MLDMAPSIRKLDETVVNRIAAGEVMMMMTYVLQ